ncbi:hypothetical protein F5Y19DRAFT_485069 [Xylariaceae sp. FL1651]|nr:hypothetical protein F5Y19DRAFT_485069 [Xylariaceae sp. FL1651]
MPFRDDWPKMSNGRDFDGQNLLTLVRRANSQFHNTWDVNLLIKEIEENLGDLVVDIPRVSNGSNNYVKFEAEVYELLQSEPDILASRLLYYRVSVRREGPKLGRPIDIVGRRLQIFQRTEGDNNVWRTLSPAQKAVHIRASLYKFPVPAEFASTWLHERLFEQKPKSVAIPVAPTCEFCVALFTSKIEATIKNIGDMIGWEDDHNTVGPVAAAAKQSLLRLIPRIMPTADDESILDQFVIDHGDFGETGCIVPAILSDPLMAVTVDLVTGEDAAPASTRLPRIVAADEMERTATLSRLYLEAGKNARHLWFVLRDWRGDDPEDYLGDLGAWAEKRIKELGVNQEVIDEIFGYPPDPISGPQGLGFIGLILGIHLVPLFSKRIHNVDIASQIGGMFTGALGIDLARRHMNHKARIRAERMKSMGLPDQVAQTQVKPLAAANITITRPPIYRAKKNYTAANAYVYALAAQRQQRSLAATAINIGAIFGVGYMERAQSKAVDLTISKTSLMHLSEVDFHQIIAESIKCGGPGALGGPGLSTGLVPGAADSLDALIWCSNIRFAAFIMHKTEYSGSNGVTAASPSIRSLLEQCTTEDDIQGVIKSTLAAKLRRVLQLSTADEDLMSIRSKDIGVDSLIAADLCTWPPKWFEVSVLVFKIMGNDTMASLAEHVSESVPAALVQYVRKAS